MEKEKPQKDVLIPLMKSTFNFRRKYILVSEDSVFVKLERFPALKMPHAPTILILLLTVSVSVKGAEAPPPAHAWLLGHYNSRTVM